MTAARSSFAVPRGPGRRHPRFLCTWIYPANRSMVHQLRRPSAKDKFARVYQPIVSLGDGTNRRRGSPGCWTKRSRQSRWSDVFWKLPKSAALLFHHKLVLRRILQDSLRPCAAIQTSGQHQRIRLRPAEPFPAHARTVSQSGRGCSARLAIDYPPETSTRTYKIARETFSACARWATVSYR